MMRATYEDGPVTVTMTAQGEWDDYGVPGSPRWMEPDLTTVEVRSIDILGVDCELSELPAKLQKRILALADDLDFEEEY